LPQRRVNAGKVAPGALQETIITLAFRGSHQITYVLCFVLLLLRPQPLISAIAPESTAAGLFPVSFDSTALLCHTRGCKQSKKYFVQDFSA
jgi:hypothetical protein